MKLLTCLCFFVTTASAAPHLGVSDGRNATLGEFPYAISIQYLDDFSVNTHHGCTGILIADQWVLTTAKCVLRSSTSTQVAAIYGGAVDISNTKLLTKYLLYKQYVHPDFKPLRRWIPSLNDIALLKLNKKVELSDNFNIATLPVEGAEPDYSRDFSVIGWGGAMIDEDTYSYSKVLQVNGNMPTLSNDKCLALLLNFTEGITQEFAWDDDLTLCTGPEDPDKILLLSGDKGGPIIQDDVVYGIYSYHLDYETGRPVQRAPSGVFTKIAPYTPWIREVISKY